MTSMFNAVHNPLDYAHTLCSVYTSLSRIGDSEALLKGFAQAASQLIGCELIQLFSFDAPTGRLDLKVQVLDDIVKPETLAGDHADYSTENLLEFALSQDRPVSVNEMGPGLYDTSFLPSRPSGWNSLLCVRLTTTDNVTAGLLVCASDACRSLDCFAASLEALGSFVLALQVLLERRHALTEMPRLEPKSSSYGLISKSEPMRRTCQLVGKVLHSSYTVLLTGETGTGKEVVARAIHTCGPRRKKAFVVQNCAAFPENLLESELFGYRKGAFTGADRDRRGLFDIADGGTLLLDEIGDMPLGLQAKLLRVLQEGEIRPLGSDTVRNVDVRIIAATHRDLPALISQGRFREDLYYRLAQFPVSLPPLRQRVEDIEPLARQFASDACSSLRREPVRWSESALSFLCDYSFPGNVRQLKGFVERAVLLSDDGHLLPEHFPVATGAEGSSHGVTLRERMEHFERDVLLESLRKSNGNRTQTARKLGVSRRTLLYRMMRLDINSARKNAAKCHK
ncbi:Anaerobic nitric oxide reductase transcription regulator NorR [Pseudomonas fluorescens]|nr:Anaerobic nitric oxide reductase transcription regulator NorR [Pseudomonas fluorescens]